MRRAVRIPLLPLLAGLALAAGLGCGSDDAPYEGRSSVIEDPVERPDGGLGPTPRDLDEADTYADKLTPRGDYRPRFYGPDPENAATGG